MIIKLFRASDTTVKELFFNKEK
ncbi:Putative phage transcriptional regulator (fragment) [Clostridioides difficile]|uniref:Putative phage transcriptional regulator n=1 Tax=Clostridioides difficile TaxID=1496 RepID=A0A069AT82_CLODI